MDSLKRNIIGVWGGLGEDSPVIQIKTDSIYYFQQKKNYLYKIYDDSLVIYFSDHKGVLRNVSIVQDTLTFENELGLITLGYRFKDKK